MVRKYHALYLTFALASGPLFGASFKSFEQGASSLGFAHADMASLAENASTNWYNAAGITRFDRTEFSVGVTNKHFDTYVNLILKLPVNESYSNIDAIYAVFAPLLITANFFSPPPASNSYNIPHAKGDTNQVVGYAHFVQPLVRDRNQFDVSFGLSATSPWNWDTDYSSTNVVGYVVRARISSFSLAPSLSIRAYNKYSVAFQGRWERFSWYESSSYARAIGTNFSLKNEKFVYNFSTLIQITPTFRVGATYDLNSIQSLKGNALLDGNHEAKTKIHLPNTLTLGATCDLKKNLIATATLAYTDWSKFKTVLILFDDSGQLGAFSTNYNFKNSYFGALGLKYQANEKCSFRSGLSLESPATRSEFREIKFHDGVNYSLGVGINYAFNCFSSLDFGYMFTTAPTNAITNNPITDISSISIAGATSDILGSLEGSAKTLIHTFGLQLNGRF